jgi:hypothetical protein
MRASFDAGSVPKHAVGVAALSRWRGSFRPRTIARLPPENAARQWSAVSHAVRLPRWTSSAHGDFGRGRQRQRGMRVREFGLAHPAADAGFAL